MPAPGHELVRRRSKGPALCRPMLKCDPLTPPDAPKQVAPLAELPVVNPHQQLLLVVLWLH